MNSNLKIWFHGLIAAVTTGLGNGISLAVADAAFNIFKDGTGLLQATIAATLVSVGAYLKQSPLPFYDFEGGLNQSPVSTSTTPKISLIAAGFLCLFMIGCVSPETGKVDVALTVEKSKPFIRPSAAAIGVGTIAVAKTNDSKVARAEWLSSVSTQVRLLTSSTPPTESELKAALMQITPQSSTDLLQVVVSISSLYSSVKGGFGKDTAAIIQVLDQIALGLQDAAAPYLK